MLAIANRFLTEEDLNDTDRASVIDMLIEFESSTTAMSEEYFAQHRHRIFIPPVVFIHATNTFKNQLQSKRA